MLSSLPIPPWVRRLGNRCHFLGFLQGESKSPIAKALVEVEEEEKEGGGGKSLPQSDYFQLASGERGEERREVLLWWLRRRRERDKLWPAIFPHKKSTDIFSSSSSPVRGRTKGEGGRGGGGKKRFLERQDVDGAKRGGGI